MNNGREHIEAMVRILEARDLAPRKKLEVAAVEFRTAMLFEEQWPSAARSACDWVAGKILFVTRKVQSMDEARVHELIEELRDCAKRFMQAWGSQGKAGSWR
jgi:hypothetical protein